MSSPTTPAALPHEPKRRGRIQRLRQWFGPATTRLNNYERAIRKDDQDAAAWVGKAESLRELGRETEARAAFEHALEISRDDADTLRGRARALRLLGRLDEAVVMAMRAIHSGDESADNWLELARCVNALAELERESGNRAKHRADVLGAVNHATETEAGSRDAAVWEQAGELLLQAGLAEESIARLERATLLEPHRATPWLLRAEALTLLRRDDEAAAARERGWHIARLGVDDRKPDSPIAAVASLGRPFVTFVWHEKRGVALTAALYLAGLILWSANAARRDLGLQAAADLQYLIAGIAPALVIALTAALLVVWFKLPAWSRDRLLRWRPRVSDGLASLAGWLVLAAIVSIAAFGWSGIWDRWPILWLVSIGAFTLGTVLGGLTRRGNPLFALLWYGYGAVFFVALAAIALVFYANVLYPWLPQSLGGGRPRCAQLDVDAASLSRSTLDDLAPNATGNATVRTETLDIVFSQDDLIFVKKPDAEGLTALRTSAVRAVIGCD